MTSPEAPCASETAFPMERHVGHLLRRAYAIARANSATALAALGDVSPVQASVLATLAEAPLTQADLGRRIGMEPANTHALVRRMLEADLLALTAAREGRRSIKRVALTPHGRTIAEGLELAFAQSADRSLAPLSADERALLLALLRRIIAADEAVHDGSTPDT